MWYKDIVDSQTGETTRETTTEYYSELEGYTKIDESCKPFYRYITSEYVYIDGKGRIVENIEYCIKDYCAMLYINRVEEEEEIVNPKTGDSTYIYLNILFISSILFIGIKLYENKKSV